jgi:hypothetical protein
MTPISIGRIALPFLALTAALRHLSSASRAKGSRQLKPEPRPPQWVSPRSPDSGDEIMPAFDDALIGPTGDAVIAGTAAPGAGVELLRNGESYDQAIADQFGHFVMVPSRLPPGDYELTLRSRQPNGKHATSRGSVAVAVQPSLTDQNMALMTPDKASVGLSKPVVPSVVRHPPRAPREATGPAAQDLSGLRRKLFNHLVGPHH